MKTDVKYRPEVLEVNLYAETETEVAFLCWLRCTTPEWDEAPPPETSVRLSFRTSELARLLAEPGRASELARLLAETGTPNLDISEGN